MDQTDDRMDVSFVIEARSVDQIESSRQKLLEIAPDMQISFVEQRSIAV